MPEPGVTINSSTLSREEGDQANPSPPYPQTTHLFTAGHVQRGITLASDYMTNLTHEVIKPVVKAFLETCDTNPNIAAVIAVPALIAFLLTALFFTLILWAFTTILSSIFFVILAVLVSLFFKLFLVFLAAIPMAGFATALLLGAILASQFIINAMAHGGVIPAISRSVQETDWNQLSQKAVAFWNLILRASQEAGPAATVLWNGMLWVAGCVHALRVEIQEAFVFLHHSYERSSSTAVSGVPQPSTREEEIIVEQPVEREIRPPPSSEHVILPNEQGSEQLELRPSSSDQVLKQRTPFSMKATTTEHEAVESQGTW